MAKTPFGDPRVEVPQAFIRRRDELELTHRAILKSGSDIAGVLLLGGRGMGKTAFLRIFEETFRSDFPGGVVQASGPITVYYDLAGMANQLLPDRLGLLVIDDAHISTAELLSDLTKLKRERPNLRILLTAEDDRASSLLKSSSLGWVVIELSPLAEEELAALCEQRGLPPDVARHVAEACGGNPRTAMVLANRAVHGDPFGVITSLGEGITTILGADGRPLDRGDSDLRQIEVGASAFNDAVLAKIAARPAEMRELSPRQFEELVAELYDREGYEVELTPISRDDGVDIYAVQHTPFGSFLTLIDCKRYRKDRPIEVDLVRQLFGTVEAKNASVGVLATTSHFTSGAKKFQRERKHRLGLQDLFSVHDMLVRSQGVLRA